LKFTEFKARYHERALEGIVSTHANVPVEMGREPADVADAIHRVLDRRGL
jgi:hypothetical protein